MKVMVKMDKDQLTRTHCMLVRFASLHASDDPLVVEAMAVIDENRRIFPALPGVPQWVKPPSGVVIDMRRMETHMDGNRTP
jgi:hypothetical protein